MPSPLPCALLPPLHRHNHHTRHAVASGGADVAGIASGGESEGVTSDGEDVLLCTRCSISDPTASGEEIGADVVGAAGGGESEGIPEDVLSGTRRSVSDPSATTPTLIGAVRPREEAWEQSYSGDVDLTPWQHVRSVSVALLVVVVLIYVVFADFSVL